MPNFWNNQSNISCFIAAGLIGNPKRSCVKRLVFITGLVATTAQAAEVPSGQPVTLSEVLVEDVAGQSWVRFRFLAPAIARDGGTVDAETAETDGFHLCETLALPYLKEYKLKADQIVVSFSDMPVTFGETSPEATQFFYQFRPENSTCIWELF